MAAKTRRVGIYAYGPVTVAVNQSVELRVMGKGGVTKLAGQTELGQGIYRLDGNEDLVVSVGGASDITIMEDKDPWPDPKVASRRFAKFFDASGTFDAQALGDFFANYDRNI